MLNKLFESLDEKVFTPELKEALESQFNEAVEAKATSIAEARIEEQIESLNEKSEQHIIFLTEKSEEFLAKKQEEMLENLDKFLDRVVDEFVVEAKGSLDESLKNEKADMIIEAFDSMLTATGVKVAKIVEAKDESAIETKLAETISKHDSLIEEVIVLKEENNKLIKLGVIAEMKEGLSIVEAEKFAKLAELVEFERGDEFATKLETIKESIKGISEKKEPVSKIQESDDTKKPIWSHLV